jgi:hypothetical protein
VGAVGTLLSLHHTLIIAPLGDQSTKKDWG